MRATYFQKVKKCNLWRSGPHPKASRLHFSRMGYFLSHFAIPLKNPKRYRATFFPIYCTFPSRNAKWSLPPTSLAGCTTRKKAPKSNVFLILIPTIAVNSIPEWNQRCPTFSPYMGHIQNWDLRVCYVQFSCLLAFVTLWIQDAKHGAQEQHPACGTFSQQFRSVDMVLVEEETKVIPSFSNVGFFY